ncbi:MAG: hypothetical protein RJQ09_21430 [Cyclobacteriaceae bacterium]
MSKPYSLNGSMVFPNGKALLHQLQQGENFTKLNDRKTIFTAAYHLPTGTHTQSAYVHPKSKRCRIIANNIEVIKVKVY